MKLTNKQKVIAIMSLFFLTIACKKENLDSYYMIFGQKVPVYRMNDMFYVMFYPADEKWLLNELEKNGLMYGKIDRNYHAGEIYSDLIELIGSGYKKFINYNTTSVLGDYRKVADVLSSVIYWAPYYQIDGYGGSVPLMETFSVKLKPKTTFAQLEKLTNKNSVELLGAFKTVPAWYECPHGYESCRETEGDDRWYELACTTQSKGNALEMANLFYSTGLFEESIPYFIMASNL